MMKRSWRPMIKVIAIAVVLSFMFSGCSLFKGPRKHFWEFWKPKPPETASIYPVPEEIPPPPPVTEQPEIGEISPLPIQPPEAVEVQPSETGIPEPPPIREPATIEVAELPMIHFDFDKYDIRPQDIPLLEKCVEWLKAHPDVQVQIQGHCDERGTREYNLNLGQKRANAVKEYLVNRGIDPSRLHTISYGEERPLDPGHNEEAWAKNRRVQFFVY